MQLHHINLDDLKPSRINVRKAGGKDCADLLPSIRSLGLLQPLLVRPDSEPTRGGGYEIIAGQRRYHALRKLAEEGSSDPIPCMVMEDGDDAIAIEASLAENVARLPTDEVDQYKAFAALIKAGSSTSNIASQFGVTERLVTQRLAIANLIGPILTAYRRSEIEPATVRALTLATKAQQKRWLDLHRADDVWAPTGRALKHWLFGGATIPVTHARFDVAASGLTVIGNLFGDEQYFADSEAFWPLQSAAVADMAGHYRDDGWADVIVHEAGCQYQSWNYESVGKEDGGEVHIVTASDGEVTTYEGVLDRDVLRKRRNAGDPNEGSPQKAEITKTMQRYLDLHRHSAVRAELLGSPGIALRLAVAQIIAGSDLWHIAAEAQKAPNETIAENVAANKAEAVVAEEREAVRRLLGIDGENATTIVPRSGDWQVDRDLHAVFPKLMTLTDEDMSRILTFVVMETLAAGTSMVEALGKMLGTDMADHWTPDETFFDLLRDKQAVGAMLREIGGKATADANVASTAKVQKKIVQDYLSGTRKGGKEGWQPRYISFPMRAYTKRGSIPAIDNWNAVKHHHA